jgi:hypothetical protein
VSESSCLALMMLALLVLGMLALGAIVWAGGG